MCVTSTCFILEHASDPHPSETFHRGADLFGRQRQPKHKDPQGSYTLVHRTKTRGIAEIMFSSATYDILSSICYIFYEYIYIYTYTYKYIHVLDCICIRKHTCVPYTVCVVCWASIPRFESCGLGNQSSRRGRTCCCDVWPGCPAPCKTLLFLFSAALLLRDFRIYCITAKCILYVCMWIINILDGRAIWWFS